MFPLGNRPMVIITSSSGLTESAHGGTAPRSYEAPVTEVTRLSEVLIQMSMSLDGFIAGPHDSDVDRLHEWMFGATGGVPGEGLTGVDKEIFDDLRKTGAMISGRRLYDITHGWDGSHPLGLFPVFVVTHDVPDHVPAGTTRFTFITDGIASAVAQAKAAAGDKNVYVVGGASIDQQLLNACLVDELRIDVVFLAAAFASSPSVAMHQLSYSK